MSRCAASKTIRGAWLESAQRCKRCTWTILLAVYPDYTALPSNQRHQLTAPA